MNSPWDDLNYPVTCIIHDRCDRNLSWVNNFLLLGCSTSQKVLRVYANPYLDLTQKVIRITSHTDISTSGNDVGMMAGIY